MTRVQTGWHDAARLSKPYWGPCWISWCRVDGAIAAVEEHDTEDEARAWCEREERIRAERRAR